MSETVTIPLRGRDGAVRAHAIVDASDGDWLNTWRWSLTGSGYAFASPGLMHRVILGLEKGDGKEVDHANRDRLDNRRANLRITSRTENVSNSCRADLCAARREEALRMYEAGVDRQTIMASLAMAAQTLRQILPPPTGPHPNLVWSRERIAEWVRGFHATHGRLPVAADFDGRDGAPVFVSVYRRFDGGMPEAREFAGFGRVDLRRAA